MGKERYLIDTNVAIEYVGETLPEKSLAMLDRIIDDQYFLSVINQIELLGYTNITQYEEEKFQELVKSATIFNLNNEIVNETIKLRQLNKIKLPDAIIAATALLKNLTIISRNTKDFNKIDRLKVINPYNL